jgi:hypothetical protein
MLTLFSTSIRQDSPRQYPAWQTLIQHLDTRTKSLQQRQYLTPGKDSPIINLMRHILSLIDYQYLFKQRNDFDRLLKYFNYARREFESLFNPAYTGRGYYNFLTSNNTNTVTYLIPTQALNIIRDCPFDKKWLYWKKARALKIICHDAEEYSINLEDDRIKFRNKIPKMMIATLDPIILGFMYFHYLQDHDLNYQIYDNRNFLHKFIFFPIQSDLLNLFLLRIISIISRSVDNEELLHHHCSMLLKDIDPAMRPTAQLFPSMYEIYNGIQSIKKNAITPNAFLCSNVLHDTSIFRYISDLLNLHAIDQGRIFLGSKYIRDYELFNIIYHIFRILRNKSQVQAFLLKLYNFLNKLYNARIWTNLVNPNMRQYVEITMETQLAQIQSDRLVGLY